MAIQRESEGNLMDLGMQPELELLSKGLVGDSFGEIFYSDKG